MNNQEIAKLLGKTGGLKTKARYGKDYYSRIGKLGVEKKRQNKQKETVDKTIDKQPLA